MPAIKTQIMDAIDARLAGIIYPGVTVLASNRTSPTQENEYPAVKVMDGPATPDSETHGRTSYLMTFSVYGYVATDTPQELRAALDGLYSAVIQAILAGDRTLGQLANDIAEGEYRPAHVDAAGSPPMAQFEQDFLVSYYNDPSNPDTQH